MSIYVFLAYLCLSNSNSNPHPPFCMHPYTYQDTLSCSVCSFKKEEPSTFLNISLDIPDNLEQTDGSAVGAVPVTTVTFDELLKKHLAAEVLDDDNMWECGGCQAKVKASKQLQYSTLPSLLVVQLKRFRFDPTTKRKRKLNTPVIMPKTFDASFVLAEAAGAGADTEYELCSLVGHNGSANGGANGSGISCSSWQYL